MSLKTELVPDDSGFCLGLAVEDIFDQPHRPAAAGTDFLPRVREGYPGGSPLLAQLRGEGVEPAAIVPAHILLDGDKANSPLALALRQGKADVGIGLDEGGWLRMAAVRHGLHAFRFFHEQWLGQGCFSLAPSVSGLGCLAATCSGLAEICRRLLGRQFCHDNTGSRILNLSSVIQFQDEAVERALQDLGAENDPEMAAWLNERWKGAETAEAYLTQSEAAETVRPWIHIYKERIPIDRYKRICVGPRLSEAVKQRLNAVQSDCIQSFREIFGQFDAVAVLLYEGLKLRDGSPAQRMLSAVSLARLPAYIMPLGQGRSLQLIYPDLDRVWIP